MGLRILCVGDMHLGRRPRRLPEHLGDLGLDPRRLTPAVAWERAVDLALAEQVDAVLLAGDVVESLEDRFEAFAHLERGVARLTEAGVEVLGVAGNHDVEALPRLARRLPSFRLLGAGGAWEIRELERRGERVRLVGWSFPRRRVETSPLESLPDLPADGTCTLGLLHCDLDAVGSVYAPVRSTELSATRLDGWLLGHIHAPSDLASPRPLGYLGSLAGLDAGEPGPRGPWLLEARGPGDVVVERHVQVAPLRYERVVVPVEDWDATGAALEERFESAVHDALGAAVERVLEHDEAARVVGVRIALVGRSPRHVELRRLLGSTRAGQLVRSVEGVVCFVEALVDEARQALDLEALARSADPPGLLARRVLALRAGGAEADALCARAQGAVDPVARRASLWGGLPESDEELRERLARCGERALEELLASGAEGGAA